MTKFKVGDRVRKVASGHLWEFKVGDELTVTGFSAVGNAWVSNGEDEDTAHDSDLELISRAPETPPATIEHEGYTYTRGERVLPDWLKDGAWVVNKIGDLKKVWDDGKNGVYLTSDKKQDILYTEDLRDQYRPHEPSDYKWGDWAMYEGKKVFVMCGPDSGGHIAISGTGMNNALSNCKFVRPHDLTPTHTP